MDTDPVARFVEDNARGFFADLDAWLRIPSVSADDAHRDDVRRSAAWLTARLTAAGFPVVEVWETGGGTGHPAVFAEWPAADAAAPTMLVYGHHDVQPVDPVDEWRTPPFEPTVVGDELFARGAADDKGQVLFHVLGLAALQATGGEFPPASVKVLIEGEEEIGSPNFRALLEDNRDRLACDAVVVSDSSMYGPDVPSLCTGMRGLVYTQIDLRGPDVDLHSGSFGGAVPNPVTVLVRMLAGLHDDTGRITLPGFYDRVCELDERERDLFGRLPFDEAAFLSTAASRALAGEAGYTTLERLWARPTCEINGVWGGYTGPGTKTIVPASAHAKVSFRLVADQQPAEVEQMLRRYVADSTPPGLDADVTAFGPGVRPCLTPLDHPALQAAAAAMARAFGTEVLFTREGGSGPEADLADVLAAPVLFVGVGLPDDRIHAPNERVLRSHLLAGARTAAYLWPELSRVLRR